MSKKNVFFLIMSVSIVEENCIIHHSLYDKVTVLRSFTDVSLDRVKNARYVIFFVTPSNLMS